MRFQALLLVVLGLLASAAADEPSEAELESQFSEFIVQYGREYATEEERDNRFAIFKTTVARNAWINSLNTTATYGINKFADISEEEFRERYLTVFPSHLAGGRLAAHLSVEAIPDSWDWRSKGAVTHVKNQQQCGSCWAFSTTGNVEGRLFLAQKSNPKLVSFSEQQLVDCDKVDQGCNGGLPSNAYQYIMQAGGIETEAAYPYTSAPNSACAFNPSLVAGKIHNWEAVSQNETQIAAYLVAHGPISIGINAEWMQTYTSGVSDPLFCNPSELDHGVLIVGYGVQDGFFGKTPYWIIKNSWGADWGENGYYLIIRGKGKCGLNTMATSALP